MGKPQYGEIFTNFPTIWNPENFKMKHGKNRKMQNPEKSGGVLFTPKLNYP